MNLNNALRRLARGPRWILRRIGLDIVRYPPADRRRVLDSRLAVLTDNTITSGPFAGVRLPETDSWGDRGSKLLGCYEQELHPAIEEVIDWKPDVILNVGCAEGYYAAGLAKRNPEVAIFAYDLDPLAQTICKIGRDMNHTDNLEVFGLCTDVELRERTQGAKRPFMLIDCEGGERDLLLSNDYNYPNASMIVECHDFLDRNITSDLMSKYSQTHSIRLIKRSGRNPFCNPSTAGWAENDLWLLVSEHRPARMHWLHMTPFAARSH